MTWRSWRSPGIDEIRARLHDPRVRELLRRGWVRCGPNLLTSIFTVLSRVSPHGERKRAQIHHDPPLNLSLNSLTTGAGLH